MKEYPIICNAQVVRNIQSGRQTQDRRPTPFKRINTHPDEWTFDRLQDGYKDGIVRAVFYDREGEPIGPKLPWQVGDVLWVREAWQAYEPRIQIGRSPINRIPMPIFAYPAVEGKSEIEYRADADLSKCFIPWRPSIHMPRWASRITLGVTTVKVERIQDISTEDAYYEGCLGSYSKDENGIKEELISPEEDFQMRWQSLYPGSWKRNDWVLVTDFRRVKP